MNMKTIIYLILALTMIPFGTKIFEVQEILGNKKNKIQEVITTRSCVKSQINSTVLNVNDLDDSGQIIHLIPNPVAGDGILSTPFEFKKKLYFLYSATGYSSGETIGPSLQLGEYDGSKIRLIPNPDSSQNYSIDPALSDKELLPIQYNDNLYIKYLNISNISQIAKFDGSKLSLIPNPDEGFGYVGGPIVYDGNLYINYINSERQYQWAKYDGKSLTIIPNPEDLNYLISAPIIYDNKLYLYCIDDGKVKLCQFNGKNITLVSSPDDMGSLSLRNHFIYNNKLYLTEEMGGLVECDGIKFKLYPNPVPGLIGNLSVIYNKKLYGTFYKLSSPNPEELVEFDGSTVTLIPNLGNEFSLLKIESFLTVYDNKLYLLYTDRETSQLVDYDGIRFTLFPNPKDGSRDYRCYGNSIIYNNKLFIDYQNGMAKCSNDTIGILPTPNVGFFTDISPVIYQGKLYRVCNKRQLAYFDEVVSN